MNMDNNIDNNIDSLENTELQEENTNNFNIPEKPKKSIKEQRNFDAKLLINYIGKNNKKFFNNKFSFTAFFFGGLYLIYRKMYVLGMLIYFIETFFTVYFVDNIIVLSIILFLILIERIFLGFVINKKYLDIAYNNSMKIQEKNFIRPDEEIVSSCKENGGTNLFLVIVLAIMILLTTYSLNNTLKKILNPNKTNNETIIIYKNIYN